MNYPETLDYLYTCAPMFQNVGKDAYKEGLENTLILDAHFNHPHKKYRTIHVAGTNGKGSCSHTLASVLQEAGYKVGLYTSPHLIDFRERIRVNGQCIPEERVIRFVEEEKTFFEPLHPSFFELTTALAFLYFAEEEVDIAVIEVGMGGRLDCTNIISPILSVITNISLDHTQFLGNTLEKIATEKAGIIKAGTPVVVGETCDETRNVFLQHARKAATEIVFAEDRQVVQDVTRNSQNQFVYSTRDYGMITGELGGIYQIKNTKTILCCIDELKKNLNIRQKHVADGFARVCSNTGLMGRWQKLAEQPLTYCDTGHNVAGISYLANQLKEIPCEQLRIVLGMVQDKDIEHVLELLPKHARFYFTQASVKRALPAQALYEKALQQGLNGDVFGSVCEAYAAARHEAGERDLIFVGGSTFVVADLLTALFK